MTKISKESAENAIKILLEYMGEDPNREGLKNTPKRVLAFYSAFAKNKEVNVGEILKTKFQDIGGFEDFIVLRNIRFVSLCEHHMLPIEGTADIAYVPDGHLVGISKLARIVEICAKKLQMQERMTAEIANILQDNIKPLGVAVRLSASHGCMSLRGVLQESSIMDTMHYTGIFKEKKELREQFLKKY